MADVPLNVLQVSTADIQGGAERVAWSLFEGCRARGHRSTMAVGVKRSHDPDVFVIPNDASRAAWARLLGDLSDRLARRGAEGLSRAAGIAAEPKRRLDHFRGVEDFHFPGTARLLDLDVEPPDIVHLHNLHGAYFDLRQIPDLSRQVPLFLTLHDAWLLSGHCAHSFDCDRWLSGCGRCPDLDIYPAVERDATAFNWGRKRDVFRRSLLFVAAPSRWLLERAERSILASAIAETRVIPNGVDVGVFTAGDRRRARERLAVPADTWMVLTAAGARDARWADFATLRRAVLRVAEVLPDDRRILLVALGGDGQEESISRARVRFEPIVTDPHEVADYYRAADLYVHPSLADNFPLTVLEAMACGTAVIANATGGIPEQIQDSQQGFLVSIGDSAELASRIVQLLRDEELRRRMGLSGTARVQREFSLERQVDSYLDWYQVVSKSRRN